jgi:very-short-patch-repair endonuclease
VVGIVARRQLALSDRAVRAAVADGRLTRVRRGWYAEPGTDPQVVRAAAVGGRLACVSALEARGGWTMPHTLHAVVLPGRRATPGVVAHTGTARGLSIEDPASAFARFATCGQPLEIAVAADSALNLGLLTWEQVTDVLSRSARRRRLLSRIDGRAESGLETIARIRLRARGVGVRIQVSIGAYRVDMLIGDRLIIELDGQRWHDTASTFESDRRRDAALVAAGFIVLRFSFRRVMNEWDQVEQQILALVRRGEHRRRVAGSI